MTRLDGMVCSIARTLDVVGEWWSMLILRDAMFGVTRFEDFRSRLGITSSVLATRLEKLVEHGILTRHQYCDRPPRSEYLLTDKGRELHVALMALMEWGDRWTAGEDGPPTEVVHATCGHPVHVRLGCDHCAEETPLSAIIPRALLPDSPAPARAELG